MAWLVFHLNLDYPLKTISVVSIPLSNKSPVENLLYLVIQALWAVLSNFIFSLLSHSCISIGLWANSIFFGWKFNNYLRVFFPCDACSSSPSLPYHTAVFQYNSPRRAVFAVKSQCVVDIPAASKTLALIPHQQYHNAAKLANLHKRRPRPTDSSPPPLAELRVLSAHSSCPLRQDI